VTVEEAIRARVVGLPAVVAIVTARVYLDKLPQSPAYPCVRVQLVDSDEGQHLRGANGVQQARVQVDAYAQEASGLDPYAAVATLWRAIHGDGKGTAATGVRGWKGVIGSPGVEILNCRPAGRTRGYDPDEQRVVRMTQDYWVTFRDA
jgi:hypothetical protein